MSRPRSRSSASTLSPRQGVWRWRRLTPALWAFVFALVTRAALPPGTMVSTADHGGAEITLCSSAGVVSAIPEGDGLKPSHHKAPAHAEGACPFAGGHAFTAPPAFAVPVATLADWPLPPAPTPVRRGMALRLRAPPPPSQAPPSVLS